MLGDLYIKKIKHIHYTVEKKENDTKTVKLQLLRMSETKSREMK